MVILVKARDDEIVQYSVISHSSSSLHLLLFVFTRLRALSFFCYTIAKSLTSVTRLNPRIFATYCHYDVFWEDRLCGNWSVRGWSKRHLPIASSSYWSRTR